MQVAGHVTFAGHVFSMPQWYWIVTNHLKTESEQHHGGSVVRSFMGFEQQEVQRHLTQSQARTNDYRTSVLIPLSIHTCATKIRDNLIKQYLDVQLEFYLEHNHGK